MHEEHGRRAFGREWFRRGRLARRLSRAGLVIGAVGIGSVLLPAAGPVAASVKPAVVLKPGNTIDISYPAIVAARPSDKARRQQPIDCDGGLHPGAHQGNGQDCDVIPVVLDIPPALRAGRTYLLSFVLTWKAQKLGSVAEVGEVYTNNMSMWLWTDPVPSTNIDETDVGPYGDIPLAMGVVDPRGDKYSLVVVNSSGANSGYTVRYSLLDVTGESHTDLSIDLGTYTPQDLSAPPPPAAAATAAPAPAPVAAIPPSSVSSPPPRRVGTLGDSQLDSLGTGQQDLGLGSSQPIFARKVVSLPPAHAPSTASLVLWLLFVPLVLLALFGTWVWRRKGAGLAGL